MKIITIRILFEDYKQYQSDMKKQDFTMQETFEEYVQRCIDNGELNLIGE